MIEKEIDLLKEQFMGLCVGKSASVALGAAMFLVKAIAQQSPDASTRAMMAEVLHAQARDIAPDKPKLN